MKRDLKICYQDLRDIKAKVDKYKTAIQDIIDGAAEFEGIIEVQESESFEKLTDLWSNNVGDGAADLADRFDTISTILGNYINDMEEYIEPKDESIITRVDRNDIWFNYTQIAQNATNFWDIACDTGSSWRTYDTIYWYNPFISKEENDAKEKAHNQAIADEKARRERNYDKLSNIREKLKGEMVSGNGSTCMDYVNNICDIHNNNVIEYENMDDAYKSKLDGYYDDWASFKNKLGDFWDGVVDVFTGIKDAAVDLVKGVLFLGGAIIYFSMWISNPILMIVGTKYGLVPDCLENCGLGFINGIITLVKDPGNTIESLGQNIADKADEEGLAYSLSYVTTDIVISVLLDKGLDKITKSSKVAGVADDLDDVSHLTNKVDDVVDAVDDVDDVAKLGKNAGKGTGKTGEGIPIEEVDPDVLKKIYPDDDAAFGYKPNKGTAYDKPDYHFDDIDWAKRNQAIRREYLEASEQLKKDIARMADEGCDAEEIARYAVETRNEQKIAARAHMTSEEVAGLEARNIKKYGNPIGPTADQSFKKIYEKYIAEGVEKTSEEIWEEVIAASLRKDNVINTLLGIKH